MRLKTYNISPPGGWSFICPHCSDQHFGAATFQSLVAQVQHHFQTGSHTNRHAITEVETYLCNRIPSPDRAEFVTDELYRPGGGRTNTILLLGRYGDIVNLLPYAYCLSRTSKVQWVVGQAFADIFKGVSYITPITYGNSPDEVGQVINVTRDLNPRIAQCWKNPDQQHLTESFSTESWRLAGGLEEFNKWPLIFDRRNTFRECNLLEKITRGSPQILVATESTSSPYTQKNELIAALKKIPGANIVDLSTIKAERPYDLLTIIEDADCLVTIDSLYLHLARACYTPVVALLSKDWLGSVAPPQTVVKFQYNNAPCDIALIVQEILATRAQTCTVTGNLHGNEDRHRRAQLNWPNIYQPVSLPRSSKQIGDSRDLPYAKDILQKTLENRMEDVIILTNDDVEFKPSTVSRITKHARRFNFGCARRTLGHQGREIYWFTREWLKNNIASMPDVILGAPKCDFILARWLRSQRGIITTEQNLHFDMTPVELPAGLIHHEEHVSSWLKHRNSVSARHNEKLWRG